MAKRYQRGFTLLETVLVVSLLSVVSLAVYNAIANGLRVWQRSQQFLLEEDAALFLDKLEYDLQNGLDYSLLAFDGAVRKISFPAVVRTWQDQRIAGSAQPELIEQIGMVQYSYDKIDRTVFRSQANYSQALNGKFGEARPLVSPLSGLKFSFLVVSGKETKWQQRAAGQLPRAVKVEIEYQEKNGNHSALAPSS